MERRSQVTRRGIALRHRRRHQLKLEQREHAGHARVRLRNRVVNCRLSRTCGVVCRGGGGGGSDREVFFLKKIQRHRPKQKHPHTQSPE